MAEDPRSLAQARSRRAAPPPPPPEAESRYGIYPEPDPHRLRRHRRRRYLPMALAITVLLLFSGLLWYAYTWSVGEVPTASLPVIAPEPGAEKVRPDNPGGLEVPHQDALVLNQGGSASEKPQVERLLPPPEAPQPLAAPAADAPAPGTPGAPAPATAQPTGAPAVPAVPQGSPQLSEALSQALNNPPPQASADSIETAAPSPPATESATTSKPAASEPAPAKAPAAPQVAAVDSGIRLQFASFKSEDSARAAWKRLQEAHPAELGKLSLTIERADLGDRGVFYRVQGGPFADRAAAEKLCTSLKAKQQDCLVVAR